MKTVKRGASHLSLFAALFFASLTSRPAWSAEPAKTPPCAAPEYRQFDFWIGDWDVFDVDNPAKRVDAIHVDPRRYPTLMPASARRLDGCVLREDYQDTEGHKGQSFSIYDARTGSLGSTSCFALTQPQAHR